MRLRELEHIFRVLSGRKRLEILRLMLDGKSRAVGEVAVAVKLSLKSTSKHVILLAQVGLLDRRRGGFSVYYQLANDTPRYLEAVLRQIKAGK